MAKDKKTISLPDLYQNEEPFFFLDTGQGLQKIRIRRVEKNCLYIDAIPDFKPLQKIAGHLVAKAGKGLIRLKGRLDRSDITHDRFDVVRLFCDPDQLTLINNRQTYRLSLNHQLKVTQGSQALQARLFNLSAGGIAFITEKSLNLDQPCVYRLELDKKGGTMEIAGVIVSDYSEEFKEDKLKFYGARFLRKDDLPGNPLPFLTEALEKILVQFVNRVLIQRRLMKKE